MLFPWFQTNWANQAFVGKQANVNTMSAWLMKWLKNGKHFSWHLIKSNGLFCLKDWNAWQGADGRSGQDHDAERGDVRHLHVYRYGHPLLRRNILLHTTLQLWDFSSNYKYSSLSAQCRHTLKRQSSFVNKSSDDKWFSEWMCYTFWSCQRPAQSDRRKTANLISKENSTCRCSALCKVSILCRGWQPF